MRKEKSVSCLLVTLQCPFLVACCVCGVPGSGSSGDSASADEESAVGLPAREGTHYRSLLGIPWGERVSNSAVCGFFVACQKEGENCPFCPLKIILDLPGYFKIKLNLLYCILEMHFKYLFKEDSCTLGIQKRRECYFQRVCFPDC